MFQINCSMKEKFHYFTRLCRKTMKMTLSLCGDKMTVSRVMFGRTPVIQDADDIFAFTNLSWFDYHYRALFSGVSQLIYT